MILRTAVERLSRNVRLTRRLPSRVGGERIYVSPDASLKFWRWNLEKAEPRLFDWAQEFVREGDVVWDIGANVGLFAFSAASLAGASGYVLAVEADIWLAGLLRKSASRKSKRVAPVDVLPVAVSESLDVARFNIAARGRSTNYLDHTQGSTQTGGIRNSVMVMTITLDWLLERLPAPRILKIDVEGAEHQVLQGAQKLLSTVRPVILCEVSSGNAQQVGALLRSYGYELFDLDVNQQERKPLPFPSFNTLARLRASATEVKHMVSLA
jgi:FkbM family methyltransferase